MTLDKQARELLADELGWADRSECMKWIEAAEAGKFNKAGCTVNINAAFRAIKAALSRSPLSREDGGEVKCRHEPYQGECAHCGIPFRYGHPYYGEAPQPEVRERIARIVAPELWGNPFSYPAHIDSKEDLERERGIARTTADAILAQTAPAQPRGDDAALIAELRAMGPRPDHGGQERHDRQLYVKAADRLAARSPPQPSEAVREAAQAVVDCWGVGWGTKYGSMIAAMSPLMLTLFDALKSPTKEAGHAG